MYTKKIEDVIVNDVVVDSDLFMWQVLAIEKNGRTRAIRLWISPLEKGGISRPEAHWQRVRRGQIVRTVQL